jgi:hypothetical protein
MRTGGILLGVAAAFLGAIGGCTSILGDFSIAPGGAAPEGQDGSSDGAPTDGSISSDAGADAGPCGALGQACCAGSQCAAPNACGAGGTCVCAPKTCATGGFACGTPPDGCGGTLPECGPCGGGQNCNSSFQCVCPTGMTKCGSACVNVQTDNNNCGGCGLTCAACSTGECLVTLASNLPNATGIAINAIKAYVTTSQASGGIYSMSLSGGGATLLTTGFPQNMPWGIVLDAQYVYWTNIGGGTVMRMPLGGQVAPKQLAASQASPRGMAIDATNLYWTNASAPGQLMKMNLSTLVVGTLVPGINVPAGVAVDATYAYVGVESDDYVIKAQLSDGTIAAQLTAFENNPASVAIDANNVYFTNEANNGDVRQVDKMANKSVGTVLGTSAAPPGGIATDGVNVYWVGNDALYKCPIGKANGCTVFAPNQKGAAFVAVDATSVYWTNSTAGTVMKLTPK